MSLVLHHCHQSRSMRTLWLLHELDVPFQLAVYPFDKSLRSPEFLTLSPAGRVPALEIDGERMFESGAITQYLCETYSPTVLGRMPGHAERKDWLAWVHFAETVSIHAAALTQQHVVLYDDAMRSPTIMNLEAKRLAKCFDAIEAQLGGDEPQDHLLSSGLSAADISVCQAVYLGQFFVKLDAWPALQSWYARLTARPAFKAAVPPEDQRILRQDHYAPWEMPA